MPTQSGNNRAGPASGKFEKVKESLKAIWKHMATSMGKKMHHFKGKTTTPGLHSPADMFFEACREDACLHLLQA